MRNARFVVFMAALVGAALIAAAENTDPNHHPHAQARPANASPRPNSHPNVAHAPPASRPAMNMPQPNNGEHQNLQDRRLERAGIHEDVRGVRDINRGAALIREGQKIGGKAGARLEQEGASLEKRGDRDIRQGSAMINHANQPMLPPARTSPPKPEPITRKSDFIWDHRQAPSPATDDRGVHIDSKPADRAPEVQRIFDDPKWADNIKRLEKEELTTDTHHWHYDSGTQYSHFQDHWGDHWYGFYGGDSHFWIRHHEGRYWWHDDAKNQWAYYHDGGWWSQDPHSSQATPVNQSSAYGSGSTSSSGPTVSALPTSNISDTQTDPQLSSGDSSNSGTSDSSDSGQSPVDASASN